MSYKPFKPSHLELINQKGREPIQPPRLLDHIKKTSLSHFEQLLAHLFSATDDLFYDLSKRASSNNEQNLYFEAMREIRVKREGIANQFLREFSNGFSHLIEAPVDDLLADEEDSYNNLSIVEGDDLEVDLALANMTSRSRDMYHAELNEFALRLDHLLLQVEVNEDNNPLDPQQLAEAFIGACQEKLEINIKAKLILYKLYEKHVLKQLGHIYADANQILVEAGILPKIPKSMDKRVVQGGAPGAASNSPDSAQPAPEEPSQPYFAPTQEFRMGYDALSLLMATARNMAFSGGVGAPSQTTSHGSHYGTSAATLPGGYNCYVFSGNPGPVMASPELTNLLTQSQPVFDQQLSSYSQPRNIIADVVQQILAERNPTEPQALEENDENVINLVAMFFDQILSDETLPVAIQSLICRLQIPILKVALKDRSFFSNPKHPARELINTITGAGVGFDESKPLERDPLYKKLVEVVQTLNRQYKADDRIFSELKTELENLIEREQRKSSMVEQRTNQTETGKSKIKQARAAAQTILYQRLKDAELPEAVHEFLTRHWLQVMVFCYLKHGPDSTDWVAHEQTVSDLIWVCTPHEDARSVQRRERLLPELMDRIEFALENSMDNANQRKTTVSELEKSLEAVHEQAREEEYKPLTEEQKEALGKGENDPKAWDEMTAVERQRARYEELSSQYFESAKNMPTGTWFEYYDPDTARTYRCKLASKIDAETYIFVNRLGFKALERSRKQFAYDMQFSRARPIDTNPFFDRIMGRVVSKLSSDETEQETPEQSAEAGERGF